MKPYLGRILLITLSFLIFTSCSSKEQTPVLDSVEEVIRYLGEDYEFGSPSLIQFDCSDVFTSEFLVDEFARTVGEVYSVVQLEDGSYKVETDTGSYIINIILDDNTINSFQVILEIN